MLLISKKLLQFSMFSIFRGKFLFWNLWFFCVEISSIIIYKYCKNTRGLTSVVKIHVSIFKY